MFNRKIINLLEGWKNKKDRKALIIKGARQTGKTTAVDMFSKGFENYIYLNLELLKDRDIFREEMDIEETFRAIIVLKNIDLKPGKTLLFIDEIQNSPTAVKMLRYFYENKKNLFVIAAGSLLDAVLNRENISFPAGRVEFLRIYPLSFAEFLDAKNETKIMQVYDSIPLGEFAREKLLKLFREYVSIGAMPGIVKEYLGSGALAPPESLYESLRTAYLNDAEKYARNSAMKAVIRHCLETIPYSAGKRIKFQGFGNSNYKTREVKEALKALELAMLVSIIHPTTAVEPPAAPDYRKSPLLQFIDTGLLNYSAGIKPSYPVFDSLHPSYRGLIVEHVVRQEIISADMVAGRKPAFWVREKKSATSEVDIVLNHRNYLIPVEVKSGSAGKLKSLQQFMEKAPHSFAARLYEGKLAMQEARTPSEKKFRLLSLPYFLAGKLGDYIEEYFG